MKRSSKKEGADAISGRPEYTLTTLQTSAVMILIFMIVIIGINAAVTYGSNKEPGGHLFNNSQTVPILITGGSY